MRIKGLIVVVSSLLVIQPGHAQFSANYQTNLISGTVSNWPGDYVIGSNTFANALIIQNAGVLSNAVGYVGRTVTGNSNLVMVSDPGSVWTNSSGLYFGDEGKNNSLVITNGGKVFSGYGTFVGDGSISNNILVTGAGSLLKNRLLNLGAGGSGNSLVVSNGGRVETEIGANISSFHGAHYNSVHVTGSGSVFQNAGSYFDVGSFGVGNQLIISQGGRVNCEQYAIVGMTESSTDNLVWVTDTNSLWDVSTTATDVSIGRFGDRNTLVITNGGQFDAYHTHVGYRSSGNKIVVTGPGSKFSVNCYIYMGKQSPARDNLFIAANGARVEDRFCYINFDSASSNNAVIVTGSNTYWYNEYSMIAGMSGRNGTLVISNGATMYNREDGVLGFDLTSKNNRATVTGNRSLWGSRWDTFAGYGSIGNSIVLSDGATITNRDGVMGCLSGSDSNLITVTGSGSLWNNQSDLYIGLSGSGNNLVITNGGRVVDYASYLGRNPESHSNKVTVTGSGSGWTNQYKLYVGCLGPFNTLTVTNGGRVTDDWGYIGYDTNSTGNQAIIAGAGSVWTNGTVLFVGYQGSSNTLVIRDGGKVANFWGFIGDELSSSDNTVRVESGGVWQNGTLCVGNAGFHNLLQVDGGSVIATNLNVGYGSAYCNNLLRIDNGSVVVTNATQTAVLEIYQGSLVLFGGTLHADKIIATNSCAQFIRAGGTLMYRTLELNPDYDVDADHIPNGWEQKYGLDPLDFFDGNEDADGDGMSNREEFLAGTNPTNRASCLRISSLAATNGAVRIAWTAVGGKTYVLQTNSYSCTNFTDSGMVITIPGVGEMVTNFLDAGAANLPARNYRIRLAP